MKELIDRINELYHKSKGEGLNEQEKEEQLRLRQEYLKGIRSQVISTLEQVKPKEHSDDCDCGCKPKSIH